MEKADKMLEHENMLLEKIAIMIDIMMIILNCSYSDAYGLIVNSKTYNYLKQMDYSTIHDSPQANLSSIGKELRDAGVDTGYSITDNNIKLAMKKMRNDNLKQN